MNINSKTKYIARSLALIVSLFVVFGCGGGGGGGSTGGGGGGGTTPTQPFFLSVSTPADGYITTASTVTVTGQTINGASVLVNGQSAAVGSDGSFSKSGVTVSTTANPTVVTVQASYSGSSYSLTKNVYYQDQTKCTLVYTATDPRSGLLRVYDMNPNIPNSARMLSPDTMGASDSDPALSPDRSTVVFVRSLNGTNSLAKVSCAGSTVVTNLDSGANFRSPSWSKNGNYIAYAADTAGNYNIYTISVGGGFSTQITSHQANDDSPTFAADNSTIVFASNRDINGGVTAGQYFNLWRTTMNPPRNDTRLYNPSSGQGPSCPAGSGKCSALSPDLNGSNQLVFQFEYTCSTSSGNPNVPANTCNELEYLTLTAPTVVSALTSGGSYNTRPRWNTAGTSAVFVNYGTSTQKIYQVPVTSGTPGTISELTIPGATMPDW